LILPATLAMVSTVLVQVGSNLYHIDARCVVESGPLAATQIETVIEEANRPGRREIKWRGKTVPVHDLRDLLGAAHGEPEGDESAAAKSWLVVRTGTAPPVKTTFAETKLATADHVAIIVDSIEGEQQALVRSLGRYAARWRGVAGANELRDGSVALVLDIPQLLEAAKL
jgi:chemotaxis protein histidine kinase CheA